MAQPEAKTRILVIFHQPPAGVRIRSMEMARYLARHPRYDVSYLSWDSPKPANPLLKPIVRGLEAFNSSRIPIAFEPDGNLTRITLPYRLNPYPDCLRFNERQLETLLQQKPFDIIISANAYAFPVPASFKGRYIYDVVDDHLSPDSSPVWQRSRAFTLRELARADSILCVSHALHDLLANEGFPNSSLIPNGVDVADFRNVSPENVRRVKGNWEGPDTFTIGYIGNHGPWAGLDLLVNAYMQFHAKFPQSRLMLIGPVERLAHYRRVYPDDSIVFTGRVAPEEVPAYAQMLDLGVLPSPLTPFRNRAMPLKIVEYGAARKRALASPLQELKTLAFPHVKLIPLGVGSWAEAFQQAALEWQQHGTLTWQPEWDATIESYDWNNVWQKLEAILDREVNRETAV